jgi:hypothetical protein
LAEGIVLMIGGITSLIYGCLDMFAPSLTIRWQIKSTAKHDDFRKVVGTSFQRWFDVDPAGEPWKNPSTRRKVRLVGGFLVIFGIPFLVLGASLIRKS